MTKRASPAGLWLQIVLMASTATPVWAQVSEWATFGPAGSALTLTVDPHNSRVLYAAGYASPGNLFSGSPLFKSTDQGSNWTPSGLQGVVPGRVRQIVVDPHNPNHIYVTSLSDGVFKSTDGGARWTRLLSEDRWLEFGYFYELAIDPKTPGIVYVGIWDWDFGLTGFLKSADGGSTWTRISINNKSGVAVQVHTVTVDPADSQVLYAGADATYRSVDGGSTWKEIAPFGALAVPGSAAGTLYLGTDDGLFRSSNRGDSWERILQASSYWGVVVNPHHAQTLYATGALGVSHQSQDGGATWRVMSRSLPDVVPTAWDPRDSNIVYCANPEGLFKSKDGGTTWRRLHSGLATSAVGAISVDPDSPGSVYASVWEMQSSSHPQALFKSNDGGRLWDRVSSLPERFVRGLAIDPRNARTLYLYGTSGVYKSTDAGFQWQPILPGRVTPALAPDPGNPGRIVAIATEYPLLANTLLDSHDSGESWTALHASLPRGVVTGFAMNNRDSRDIFLGTRTGLHRSLNGGETWSRIGPPFRDSLPAPFEPPADSFSIDPQDSNRIVTAECRVLHTTSDGGENWTSVHLLSSLSLYIPFGCVRVVRFHPLEPQVAYAGADFGFFKTIDGGQNWSFVSGFPQTAVTDVAFDSTPGKIYVTTGGAGIFATFQSIETPRIPQLSFEMSAYCAGQPWTLRVASARADSPIGLYGISNSHSWKIPSWRQTSSMGAAEHHGTFDLQDAGNHELWVEVDGATSNDVSFRIATVCP